MHLVQLLKELRLLKGQAGYRYCLAWLAVLIHVGAKPAGALFVAWLAISSGLDVRLAKVVLFAVPHIARSIGA